MIKVQWYQRWDRHLLVCLDLWDTTYYLLIASFPEPTQRSSIIST